jgi:hypothetical protein
MLRRALPLGATLFCGRCGPRHRGFALGKANFARLVTNQRLFERPLSIASGWAQIEYWLDCHCRSENPVNSPV